MQILFLFLGGSINYFCSGRRKKVFVGRKNKEAHALRLRLRLLSYEEDVFSFESIVLSEIRNSSFGMVPYRGNRSNSTRQITYFGRMIKETQCARRSIVSAYSPEVSCQDQRMEDRDLGGTKNVCMIMITNMDKKLSSTVAEFLRRYTSLSVRVFIFPNLSMEVYTRGAIMVHSEKEFQELCGFLNNPNCIITSSTGRWLLNYMVCLPAMSIQ
ncbi:uncharacterized protein LOC114182494 isoform X2 [Vigna unguiculata]|uniref:uncharacterized protein LOC114182494 isoform X2 n=1 Tax=Vigna unguiculata TaxID=3917 RepID=UPI001016CC7E|nr:uncharacterized protein LOC114182494 isoform X2 [Vigna unguiculata]